MLFLASGLLRFGDGTGAAIAREVEALSASRHSAAEPAQCQTLDGTEELLVMIHTREAQIEARELALADRLQALAVAERVYREDRAALVAAEEALSETMESVASAAQEDVSQLVSVYENMKQKDAAALFEEMDPEFAAGFLGRMRADAAAGIMAGLKPETAYTISVVLAGRNALAPTN